MRCYHYLTEREVHLREKIVFLSILYKTNWCTNLSAVIRSWFNYSFYRYTWSLTLNNDFYLVYLVLFSFQKNIHPQCLAETHLNGYLQINPVFTFISVILSELDLLHLYKKYIWKYIYFYYIYTLTQMTYPSVLFPN